MSRIILASLLLAVTASAGAAECVILLHGLIRTAASMEPMQEALADAGFETINVDYPSREYPIERLAPLAIDEGLAGCRSKAGIETVHFVTHSLGGILVRQYLSTSDIPELGRVVMLAPPNQGSKAADELRDVPGFDWVHGPAGEQLGKGEGSVPLALGPVEFELGVIAGTGSIDPIGSAVLDDPDDGKVSVEDTKVEGMDDFVVTSHSHAMIMRMSRTIELTIQFLRTGSFESVDSG